jgi:hypothetical protein
MMSKKPLTQPSVSKPTPSKPTEKPRNIVEHSEPSHRGNIKKTPVGVKSPKNPMDKGD